MTHAQEISQISPSSPVTCIQTKHDEISFDHSLFQEACGAYLTLYASIIGPRAEGKKIVVKYQNPRDFVDNKWGKVDERPYGGGPGMVMMALPVIKATEKALKKGKKGKKIIVWFSPSGKQFTNKDADALAKYSDVVLVCGGVGIDER